MGELGRQWDKVSWRRMVESSVEEGEIVKAEERDNCVLRTMGQGDKEGN